METPPSAPSCGATMTPNRSGVVEVSFRGIKATATNAKATVTATVTPINFRERPNEERTGWVSAGPISRWSMPLPPSACRLVTVDCGCSRQSACGNYVTQPLPPCHSVSLNCKHPSIVARSCSAKCRVRSSLTRGVGGRFPEAVRSHGSQPLPDSVVPMEDCLQTPRRIAPKPQCSVHGSSCPAGTCSRATYSSVYGANDGIGPVEEKPPRVGSVLGQLRVAECEADGHQVVSTGSGEMPAELRGLGAARDGRVAFLMRWRYTCLRCTAVASVNAPTSELDLVLAIRTINRGNGHVTKSNNGRNPQLLDGPLGAVWVQSVGTAE